ncbi:MAG: hypothetical protein ACYDCO_25130 [Armatimonadota bacterium]
MKYITLTLAFLFLVFLAGCPTTKPVPNGTDTVETSDASSSAAAATGDIKIEDGAGKLVMKIKQDGTDYKIRDANEKTIGQLKVADGKVTIDDPNGKKLGSVKLDGADLKLDDANGKKLFALNAKDGGYRVKDAKDTMLLKIKPKDDGFKLGDNDGKELGKVKAKGSNGKLKIMNSRDQTLYVIAGPAEARVVGVLIVKQLTPLQRAAFIVAGGL